MNFVNNWSVQMSEGMAINHKGYIYKTLLQIMTIAGRFGTLAVLACAFAHGGCAQAPALATPQFEMAGTFSYMRGNADDSGGGFNLDGASASFAYNYRDRFSFVGDLGAYRFYGLGGGLSSTMYTYMAGPRLPLHRIRRIKPFLQVLAGGGRLNASSGGINAGENSFAMAIGGGADFAVTRRLAVRLIEGDFLLTRFAHPDGSSATQNNLRISAGLVFRFGTRE